MQAGNIRHVVHPHRRWNDAWSVMVRIIRPERLSGCANFCRMRSCWHSSGCSFALRSLWLAENLVPVNRLRPWPFTLCGALVRVPPEASTWMICLNVKSEDVAKVWRRYASRPLHTMQRRRSFRVLGLHHTLRQIHAKPAPVGVRTQVRAVHGSRGTRV